MSRRTFRKIAMAIASILLSATVSYLINHFLQQHYRKITVAHDTTFVLGPTFPDGCINFLAALNTQFAAGVTPENNAALPLYLATNPKDFYTGARLDAYLAAIGLKAPPDPQNTYIDFPSFMFDNKLQAAAPPDRQAIRNDEADLRDAWSSQIEAHQKSPWTRDQDPSAYAWLQRNAPVLQLVTDASHRDRLFIPQIGRSDLGTTLDASVSNLAEIREFANLLAVHSMLSLGNHDFPAWRDDQLAQQRLGRLLLHAPNLIQALIGIALIQHADDQIIAALPSIPRQQGRELLTDLRALPPPPDIVDCEDQCMRLETIAELSTMARFGPAAIDIDRSGNSTVPLPAPASFGFQPAIHFDNLLRQYNTFYDRRIAAARLPAFSQRKAALDSLETDRLSALASITGSSPTAAIQQLIFSPFPSGDLIQDNMREKNRLVQVALLMTIYRADHNSYPQSVNDLTDLQNAANDIFADEQPLHFLPTHSLIYSIGPNQRDDGGIFTLPKPQSLSSFQPSSPRPRTSDHPDDIPVSLP